MKKLELYYCNACNSIGINDNTNEIKWAKNIRAFNKYTGLNLTLKYVKENAITSYYGCDHCINNWGMDICSCGSGKSINKCSCKSNRASQVYKKESKRSLWVY